MAQWQYRTEKMDISTMTGPKVSTSKVDELLGAAGREGWELVSAVDTVNMTRGSAELVLIFKREG